MKVLISDEQSLFRDGLALKLKQIVDNIDIIQTSNINDMMKSLSSNLNVDLLIFDIDMANDSPYETLSKIKSINPQIKIITTSSSEEIKNIKKILSFGVKGYIPKKIDSNILNGALKLILDGGIYIPQALLDGTSNINTNKKEDTILIKKLTNRQSQVLDLIAQGKSNKQIAYDIGVSEATVKLHINSLLRSLKVNNRTQAVITAQKIGLI